MALNKRKALKELVAELEKNYLLQHACSKLGLSRSTVYRWMRDSKEFALAIQTAQGIGRRYTGDYVESKLLKNIENQDQRAIEFWLKNNKENYRSHEKLLQKKIDSLHDQIKQSNAALAVYDKNDLIDQFIDWDRVKAFVESRDGAELSRFRKGVYKGASKREAEVLDQVRKVMAMAKLAKIADIAGSKIPKENNDLVE